VLALRVNLLLDHAHVYLLGKVPDTSARFGSEKRLL